ncbi:MAG: tyrosine-type recombinase/integrase [Sedimenticola sp.]
MIINFLTHLFDSGIGYSGINTARSALSNFIGICSDNTLEFSNNPLISKFMRGVFNKRPSLPKYASIWDPDIVLQYFVSLGEELTLLQLSQKVCILLAILTGQRGQFIHLLNVEDIQILHDKLYITIPRLLKQSRPGYHQENIVLSEYPSDRKLCVVSAITQYLTRTKALRGAETQLLISTQSPFKAIARATVSSWIKSVMLKAGIDTKLFTPHSTRAAATSAARTKAMPIETIMKAAGWSQTSTFQKFYSRPIQSASVIQQGVLQTCSD